MSALTRRPDTSHHGWHVYFGDVRIGQIGKRAGVPKHIDAWGWTLGFHPGMSNRPTGGAPSFEVAREQFEAAWSRLAPTLSEEDFETWRRDRDFHAWKHRMWGTGHRLPTQTRDGRAHCFCGEAITNADIEPHIQAAHSGIGT
ncbi:hypothetical protein JQ581_30295 [Bradyrhizobium liaoningense]|uniref:hypothetical protein n=1 Tax=Bradyrhizobium liaoningense TaxID=43992 RepID=UPI001BABBEA4|nr:hypothetical protein [Bradyrhizobium liaoningense]MBR0741230.1 hypothetical protein [Bradyrhizobium liaoningense]